MRRLILLFILSISFSLLAVKACKTDFDCSSCLKGSKCINGTCMIDGMRSTCFIYPSDEVRRFEFERRSISPYFVNVPPLLAPIVEALIDLVTKI